MSDHERLPEETSQGTHLPHLSPVHIIAAAIVAVASLAAAVAILLVIPTESGLAAAGAVATTGIALAGRLGGLPR